jgi:hypothetical protein
MRILIRGLNNSNTIKCFELNETEIKTFHDLTKFIQNSNPEINDQEIIFSCNGINKRDDEEISNSIKSVYDIKLLERGGKGGFGSLLKGQPPVKKRTNNFDSCRDLSGRRIRHVNQEKMLREWQGKKMEEEKIIKMYNNPDENKKVDEYVDSDKKRELIEMNRKYLMEATKSTESIVKSVKFVLKKKRNREEKKIVENEKSDINEPNKKSNNLNNIDHLIPNKEKSNNLNKKKEKLTKKIIVDDLTKGDEVEEGKEDLEKKLFSLY